MYEEPADQLAVRLAAVHEASTKAREPFATQAYLAAKDLFRAVNAADGIDRRAIIAGALIQFARVSVEHERAEAKKERKMALDAALRRVAQACEKASNEERGRIGG